ncbi:MAG: hypothetical protein RML40_10510 [Bacteroidota bacterium]|nr:hypothetical protein [Candidatus Kapabacteria bacterium]MDW8220945.1 hypothetical protein [Bacteroidota bacterium]
MSRRPLQQAAEKVLLCRAAARRAALLQNSVVHQHSVYVMIVLLAVTIAPAVMQLAVASK